MKTFEDSFRTLIQKSIFNNYAEHNYDELRFGPYTKVSFNERAKNVVKKLLKHNKSKISTIKMAEVAPYLPKFEKIWKNLNKEDKSLFLNLIAYRLLGSNKIILPLNNPTYWQALKTADSLVSGTETYNPNFLHFILQKFDLNPIGYNIKLFFSSLAIAIDFIIEQYAYKQDHKTVVGVDKGDYVLDLGGCWGDTALYFAHKTGANGKVFSFEFIPENIKLHQINTGLNPALKPLIELVNRPVSDKSDVPIYYKDFGPASTLAFEPFADQTGSTTTLSVDDFVRINELNKVDFIKMDIEGSEPLALQGAIETIKKYKPKLAIAIYHSLNDFANIPTWILDLNIGYEIFLGHYTIHSEETIIFAKIKNQ